MGPLITLAPDDHVVVSHADVGVVICAYSVERWTLLCEAVESALAQDPSPREVVIVIDHNPALFDRARKRFGASALVVENAQAVGVSGARNTGVDRVGAQFVAFLDDDAVAGPGCFRGLLDAFDDPNVIGVDARIRPRWEGDAPTWFPAEFLWVVGCSYRGLPTRRAPVRNLIGAAMMFRRATFLELGGFRADLGRVRTTPLGCEETEFSIRATTRKPGSLLLHEPTAHAWHTVPGHRMTWRYFRQRCLAEGRSKAAMASMVGSGPALATERSYVARTIPTGVIRSLGIGSTSTERRSVRRALALVAGVLITTAGYALQSYDTRKLAPREAQGN